MVSHSCHSGAETQETAWRNHNWASSGGAGPNGGRVRSHAEGAGGQAEQLQDRSERGMQLIMNLAA